MIAAALLVLRLSDGGATVSAVVLEAANGRPVVRAVTWGPVGRARVERDGRDLLLVLPAARAVAGLALPEPVAEIRALALEEAPEGLRIRIRLDSELQYDLRQEREFASVSIRPATAVVMAPQRPVDLRELYAKILPPPSVPAPEEQDQAVGARAPEPASEPDEGLRLAFVRVRPYVVVSYVDANTAFLDTPQPVRDRYVQIEPHLGFGFGGRVPVPGRGRFLITYEPRFRAATSFDQLRHPSHLATGSVDLPIGTSVTVSASHHFARGLMETTEVDPGREYFFRLAPFRRNQSVLGVAITPGGFLALDVGASRDSVHVDDEGGFFDHRMDAIVSNLKYQFAGASRAYLRYEWVRVPTPAERPIAESRASTVSLGVAGDLLPLLSGDLSVGLRYLSAPRAGAGGKQYRGTIAAASLRKEFTPAASLTLKGRRDTYPSAFEDNAFYVSTSGGVETDLGLPLSLVFHGGVGWQRNAYRVPANGLSVPRRDEIMGWSVGLGRAVTRWSFLRADYRYDRRTSNLGAFETTGHVFMVQLGVGYLGSTPTGVVPR